MKQIWLTFSFLFLSLGVMAQSERSESSNSTPNAANFKTHQEYSDAKEDWASKNESHEETGAIELEAFILEGDEAELEFIHPTKEPSKIKGRTEATKCIDPEIEMPTPE